MTAPVRIQRKRTKGWRMPANTVYVGRSGRFGNPFTGKGAAARFRRWWNNKMSRAEFFVKRDPESWALFHDKDFMKRELHTLRGKNLACWCPLDQPCHADVLLELANK